MIATLTGTIAEKLAEIVVLEVGGVGYGVLVAMEDYGQLSVGDQTRLYIYEHIRETSHDLYGFRQLDYLRLFEQLIGVNGVGPKVALSILGLGPVEDVRRAIAGGEAKFIQAAPGVGKRVAERVVIDLKDKVGLLSSVDTAALLTGASSSSDEAIQALMALGYSQADAVERLRTIDTKMPTEERVRQALQGVR